MVRNILRLFIWRQANGKLKWTTALKRRQKNFRKFLSSLGNLPIIDVPQVELLFKIKHHLLLNHRETLPDSELSEAFRSLLITCPELDTPVKLFRYLELQTNYSPYCPQRTNSSVLPCTKLPHHCLETTLPFIVYPLPSCSTFPRTVTDVPFTTNESPI